MRDEKSQNTEPIAEESRGPGDVPVLRAHGVTGPRQSPLSIPLNTDTLFDFACALIRDEAKRLKGENQQRKGEKR